MWRRRLAWVGLFLLVVLLLAIAGAYGYLIRRPFPATQGRLAVPGLEAPVEVLRDRWGVPYIYAQTEHDLFFAQGYVHAQDRLWQMDFQRRIAGGSLSEVLGDATLEIDRFIRTLGVPRAAARTAADLDPESRAVLEAYAEGVNAFIRSNRGRLPLEFTLLGYEPRPWAPADSIGWGFMMAWDLSGNWKRELLTFHLAQQLGEEQLALLLPDYPRDAPSIVSLSEATARAGRQGQAHQPRPSPEPALPQGTAEAARALALAWQDVASRLGLVGGASNNWAVSGQRTDTGRPYLANDPHLGIQMPSIWYEVQLRGGRYQVAGFSLPGVPAVILGHNERIAWGATNLGSDVQDFYVERLHPQDAHQIEIEGAYQPLDVRQETIQVKGGEAVTIEVRVGPHGPIMTDVLDEEGLPPLALQWTPLIEFNTLRAALEMNRASGWEEFRAALRHWSAPSQNFVYADVEGNIGYQMPGLIPIRSRGDGTQPVPGWSGEYQWQGYVPYQELPSILNPEDGLIVTANNRVVDEGYPYFLSRSWSHPWRAERILALLADRDGLSLEDMQEVQRDVMDGNGPVLVELATRLEGLSGQAQAAAGILQGWDGQARASSAGAAIAEAFHVHLLRPLARDEVGQALWEDYLGLSDLSLRAALEAAGDPANPLWNGRFQETAREAFEAAVAELVEAQGPDPTRWQWGQPHTAVFDHPLDAVQPLDRIFNRGPLPTDGAYFTVNRAAYVAKDPYRVEGLSSFRAVWDTSDWDRSLAIHTTGQSGLPFHPHYGDMIGPWAGGQYHPAPWTRAAVEAAAVARLELVP